MIILQGERGSGKTSLLQDIAASFAGDYIDCSKLTEDIVSPHAALLDWIGEVKRRGVTTFLLDNIDCLPWDTCSISSIFTWLHDDKSNQLSVAIIATCTNCSLLHQSIFHDHGPPLILRKMSKYKRMKLIEIIFYSTFHHNSGCHSDFIDEVLQDTQGCSIGDIILTARNVHLSYHAAISRPFSNDNSSLLSQTATMLTLSPHSITSLGPFYWFGELHQSDTPPVKHADSNGSNSLSSLIGFEEIIHRLQARVLDPYENGVAETYHTLGINPCSGVLISGPHGSGKSSLAQWLLDTGRRQFRSISVSCADLVHKVVGESEQRIAQLFSDARELAPCFLVLENLDIILGQLGPNSSASTPSSFSEVSSPPVSSEDSESERTASAASSSSSKDSSDIFDSSSRFQSATDASSRTIGSYRSRRTAHAAVDRLLSSLLVEIDGLRPPSTEVIGGADLDNHKARCRELEQKTVNTVIVIATTCDPDLLDRALTRPGRLEEHVVLHLPDYEQRIKIVSSYVQKTSLSSLDPTIVEQIASTTEGKSPAELRVLVQEAAMDQLRREVQMREEAASVRSK